MARRLISTSSNEYHFKKIEPSLRGNEASSEVQRALSTAQKLDLNTETIVIGDYEFVLGESGTPDGEVKYTTVILKDGVPHKNLGFISKAGRLDCVRKLMRNIAEGKDLMNGHRKGLGFSNL